MTDPLILFVATAGSNDISVARREPDGTLRRAEYANINWLDRLSQGFPAVVSLDPQTDLGHFSHHMSAMLAKTVEWSGIVDLKHYLAGYFAAMQRYHGSDFPPSIAGPRQDLYALSEAVGVPVQAYTPEKNSTHRLNWTMRLWERTKL